MEEMKVGKLILQCMATLGIIVYYFSNLIAKLMSSKKTVLDQYFKNIQIRMKIDSQMTIDDSDRKHFFFFTDVTISGLIVTYLAVYIGACHLHSSYGLIRID